jgi:pectate lyase
MKNTYPLRFGLYGLLAILILLLTVYIRMNGSKTLSSKELGVIRITPASSAFPGAEGFGTTTPGGRYGRVLVVSNLNDTTDVNSPGYAGSLRWALEETWPDDPSNLYDQRRIVIFSIGGIISLVDRLILKQPFITIAGQTAPGDGITLRGGTMVVATHDVIIRGIRVRVGDREQPNCCLDGINISTYEANSDVYNVVIDHSSVSWAIDENMSTWIDPNKPYVAQDITIQWSVISEGLYNSIHLDEGATVTDPHSMGLILGQDGTNMTVHHNIFAHNWGRNPRISGIVNSEIINNIIYGWGDAAVEINNDKNITHVLNNYFKADLNSSHQEIRIEPMPSEGQVYVTGNITYDFRDSNKSMESRIHLPENFELSQKLLFVPSNVTVSSAETAYQTVLRFAGVIYPVRDLVDQRIVNDVKMGTGRVIDSQDQVGGWPNYQNGTFPEDSDNDGIPSDWEIAHNLNPSFSDDANNPNILAPDGYPWLEEYINSLIPSP